jgi:hypothetical protein
MYKRLGTCIFLILCGCTTDPTPDEDFEGPTGNFPLLGTVPDRPVLPTQEELKSQQTRLQQEHDQATLKQAEILKANKS